MNLTSLESIFLQLIAFKTPPSQWSIDQIRSFCDLVKLEWAKDILRIHNREKLNTDHLLLNNVLQGPHKRKLPDKKQEKISILDAYNLQNDVIKEVCLSNQFFYKNYSDKNIQYQIIKLKIWSFIINIYEANRLSLKRLQGLHRSKICSRGKCCRCQGPEGKCTCELLQDLLLQINCQIKQIFIADQDTTQHRRNNELYIKSNLIKLVFTNQQYLPKESPIFWDCQQLTTLLKIVKLDYFEDLFTQNLIDGFIISILGKSPFKETSQLLKLFDFSLQTKINSIRLQAHSKLSNLQKYSYIQNVFLLLFYLINTLNQTIYNFIDVDQFQQENQQISKFDYFDLYYFKAKCPEIWKKSPDKKAQTSDNLETFKVFNLEDGRHTSIAIDAFRSNSVNISNNSRPVSMESSVRQRQELMYCQKELEKKAHYSSDSKTTESTPLLENTQQNQSLQESVYFPQPQESNQIRDSKPLQESVYMQDNKQMQESVYFPNTQSNQDTIHTQNPREMQESVYFSDNTQMQQSVYMQDQRQMQESVYMVQKKSVRFTAVTTNSHKPTQMQESVYFTQQMQASVVFPQNNDMQQSVVFQQLNNNDFGQSQMIGQSVVMGQSVMVPQDKNNDQMGQSIAIEKIIEEVHPANKQNNNKLKLQVNQQQDEKQNKLSQEPQNRTPKRQKRIKLLNSIEQATLNTIIRNPFILSVSHQMKIKSEQFHKILLINLVGATFGRSQDNQFVLQDQSKISSKHARIIIINDRFHLQDLGSKRGTFLNANKMKIQKQMIFYIGDKQAFQVLDLDESSGQIILSFDKESIDTKQIQLKIGETWSIGRDLKRANYQFIGYPIHQMLSQIHCIISYVQKDGKNKFVLDDQNSKNGTWLRLSDKKSQSDPQILLKNSKFNLAFEIQYEVIDEKKQKQAIWIQKEGHENLENSILVNVNVGENCQPIPKYKKQKENQKQSCHCEIF